MASPQTITIISNARLLSVSKPEEAPAMPSLPKYAIGLFDSKNGPGPRRRKRLTHLTPEEKIMRRKLKNRVAAQTARDRKKLRLDSLEEAIQKVQNQARELLNVNMQLLERAESLENENKMLREKLGMTSGTSDVVNSQKHNLQRIKTEFDETVQSVENDPPQPDIKLAIPDSILSPDESSADENETAPSRKRPKPLTCDDRRSKALERDDGDDDVLAVDRNVVGGACAAERASPMPAVHEEYLIVPQPPQQQEVTPLTQLIRSHCSPPPTTTPVQPPPRHQRHRNPNRIAATSQQMSFSDCSMKSQTITEATTMVPLDLRRPSPLR
jgi:regulator of replication initiation timing